MPVDLKKDDMGDVVKDFYKSDAPQFKGKSKKKRREMAIAAKLSAESALHFQEAERSWHKGYDSGDKTVPRRKALDRAEYFDNRGENERAHKIRRIAISKDHGETDEARRKAKTIKISDKVGKLRPASIDDKRGAVSGDVQKKLTDSFDHKIDPKKFKKDKRDAKIGNLHRNTENEGEKKAAESKLKGPKLFGEGKLDRVMDTVRKYTSGKKKKPTPHKYPPGASGGDAEKKIRDWRKKRKQSEHEKYVNFLPANEQKLWDRFKLNIK